MAAQRPQRPKAVALKEDGFLYPIDSLIPVQCTDINIKDPNQNCYGQARYRCAHKRDKKEQCTMYLCNVHALESLNPNEVSNKYCSKHQIKTDPDKKEGCEIQ